ncbi:TadE family type IV pilus minor pilin [Allonocardiopsis opalescens]|uniref:TadE-like protein n=1 Tax=Allonocardiopsis opalescens TaxID=1144618 RepID=A0A2T0Q6L7_9ACTN|nr:TadE family type IV pilus minor pilin [Allonocardiopsis opalescens]PRX99470.1 hypothetical protein CLV72_10366 [Allonocardiopsis opalescens]
MRAERGPRRRGGQRGAVTAETAIALPAVVLLLGMALSMLAAASAQVACADAARSAARLAARGESDAVVGDTARQLGPPGARVAVEPRPAEGSVRVAVEADVPLWMAVRVTLPVHCATVARLEPGRAVPGGERDAVPAPPAD